MESLSVQMLGQLAAAVVAVLAIVGVFIRIGKFMMEQKGLRDDVNELKGKAATQTQVDNTTRLLQDQLKALQHSIEQLGKRVEHLFGPEPSYARQDQVELIIKALGPQGIVPLQQQVELILKAIEARKQEGAGG